MNLSRLLFECFVSSFEHLLLSSFQDAKKSFSFFFHPPLKNHSRFECSVVGVRAPEPTSSSSHFYFIQTEYLFPTQLDVRVKDGPI